MFIIIFLLIRAEYPSVLMKNVEREKKRERGSLSSIMFAKIDRLSFGKYQQIRWMETVAASLFEVDACQHPQTQIFLHDS